MSDSPRVTVVTNGNLFAARGLAPLLLRHRERWRWQIFVTTGLRDPDRSAWSQVPALLRRWGPRLSLYRAAVVLAPRLLESLDGRPRTVTGLCRSLGLEVQRPRNLNHPDPRRRIQDFQPDLLLSFSCPYRLGSAILELPRRGAVNVHTSLLPAFAGIGTYFHALAEGVSRTGVSIHAMEQRLDAGPVLVRESRPIAPGESAFGLFADLCGRAGRLLPPLLEQILEGEGPAGEAQDPSRRSYRGEPDARVVRDLRRRGHALLRRDDLPGLLAPLSIPEAPWRASAR
mgnify:CR=1 FL=1